MGDMEVFFSAFMLQNVIMGPMDMAVLTTVVVTVWITFHATSRLGTVTGDVVLDIQTATATNVCPYTQQNITYKWNYRYFFQYHRLSQPNTPISAREPKAQTNTGRDMEKGIYYFIYYILTNKIKKKTTLTWTNSF